MGTTGPASTDSTTAASGGVIATIGAASITFLLPLLPPNATIIITAATATATAPMIQGVRLRGAACHGSASSSESAATNILGLSRNSASSVASRGSAASGNAGGNAGDNAAVAGTTSLAAGPLNAVALGVTAKAPLLSGTGVDPFGCRVGPGNAARGGVATIGGSGASGARGAMLATASIESTCGGSTSATLANAGLGTGKFGAGTFASTPANSGISTAANPLRIDGITLGTAVAATVGMLVASRLALLGRTTGTPVAGVSVNGAWRLRSNAAATVLAVGPATLLASRMSCSRTANRLANVSRMYFAISAFLLLYRAPRNTVSNAAAISAAVA